MNIFLIIILATVIFSFLLEMITDYLNLKSLKPELPAEFSDVFDREKYAQSQNYTQVNTRFSMITSSVDLAALLGFWFLGGFNLLDLFIRSFGFSSIINGILFIGALLLLKGLISLPFSLYHTFVIEEKFGFNKTTVKTFILDMVKGLLLGLIIGVPLLSAVLYFFESAGDAAWLICWISLSLFSLILQYIAPTWIMPLFNRFTPLEDGELKSSIMKYAQSVNFPVKDVFVMDGSKRSSKSNAFFTGFGKNKRIALFDTLIAQHTVEELTAVIAHEIGHYKKKHIQQGMIISMLHSGVLFFVMSLFLNNRDLFGAFFMENISVYAGLIFFGMLYAPIELLLGIVMQVVSRKNEFEADAYAVETYGNPSAMVDSLKKLSVNNLSNLTPHPLNVFLNYSHPPVMARITAIRNK